MFSNGFGPDDLASTARSNLHDLSEEDLQRSIPFQNISCINCDSVITNPINITVPLRLDMINNIH